MRVRFVFPRVVAVAVVCGMTVTACGDDGDDAAPPSSTSIPVDDTTTSTSTGDPMPGPPTTRGPAPTVTVVPFAGGSRAVLAGEPAYTGVLGQLDPDQAIVAPVALPPAPLPDGVAPLTGLAMDVPSAATSPAILAKVDNTDPGRPQEALAAADLVYEEIIEGGATRLAAVFHSSTAVLGPIRSGRTTDIALIGSLNEPIFVWSGANRVHAALLREQAMVDDGAQTRGEYVRAQDRPGTYNLMVDGSVLRDLAVDEGVGGTPPPHFEYRNDEVGLPATARPATSIDVAFPLTAAHWDWDPGLGGWARTQGGTPHTDAQGRQVVAANVVVAEVEQVPTGSVDTAGSTVYEQLFVGSGRGWVFTDGHVVEVTWTKPSIRSVATWTTPDDVPVALTPGITWVELTSPDTTTWF